MRADNYKCENIMNVSLGGADKSIGMSTVWGTADCRIVSIVGNQTIKKGTVATIEYVKDSDL